MLAFSKIRDRAAARKGGEAVLASLLGAAPDNAALTEVPDDRTPGGAQGYFRGGGFFPDCRGGRAQGAR